MKLKNKFIPLSVPNLIGNEKKYLKNCVKTSFVSSVGKYVKEFEKKMGNFLRVKHTISCNSGTSALHLALRVAGVKDNDEVIVPSMSFIATANSVRYLNARPIFVDCDQFYNIDCKKTKFFILNETFYKNKSTFNKKTKRKISALIVVHVFGNAADFSDLIQLCKQRNIKIIEDAAGALGTKYTEGKFKNKFAGTIGDLGCISFNGNKIITCGGGGMILTNNKDFAKKSLHLSTQASTNKFTYTHDDVGYNYRLTNIQAAVGLAQLEKIENFLKIKKKINKFYSANLKNLKDLEYNNKPNYASNNCWMLSISLKNENINFKNKVIKILLNYGVETRSIWKPLHLQKPYKKFQNYKVSNSEKVFNNTLNLPSSTNLRSSDLKKILATVKKVFKN